MERGTERDDGGPRKENAGPLESRSFQSNCLRACWPLLLSYILSRPLEWKGRKGGTRRTTRAIEKEKEVERGRASERDDDDGASEDAGKDEKLPLSSGGVVLVVVVVVLVGGLAAASASVALPSFFSFSSFLLRRKWPLDVTVIILRASLARKNERTRARERERERAAHEKCPWEGKGGESEWAATAAKRESDWTAFRAREGEDELEKLELETFNDASPWN